jgi:hypothetical protein
MVKGLVRKGFPFAGSIALDRRTSGGSERCALRPLSEQISQWGATPCWGRDHLDACRPPRPGYASRRPPSSPAPGHSHYECAAYPAGLHSRFYRSRRTQALRADARLPSVPDCRQSASPDTATRLPGQAASAISYKCPVGCCRSRGYRDGLGRIADLEFPSFHRVVLQNHLQPTAHSLHSVPQASTPAVAVHAAIQRFRSQVLRFLSRTAPYQYVTMPGLSNASPARRAL